MFEMEENRKVGANLKVVGIGGGGCNAVNTMIKSGLAGVEFLGANTDAQALANCCAPMKVQLGANLTKGLGAGANPEVGRSAILEDKDKLREILTGADMVFITAGLGGGTGTGGAPILASIAKEVGALTVAVVTKPFLFEGKRRQRQAEEGMKELRKSVDTLITIPNQRLLNIAGRDMSLLEAFRKADEVLLQAVQGISDLITVEGLINLDFADVRTVMGEMGMALMGTGSASGEKRAVEAAQRAISSPLLEDITITGARGNPDQRDRRPGPRDLRGERGLYAHPGRGARGREHYLRGGHRREPQGRNADHRDRHGFREDRCTRGGRHRNARRLPGAGKSRGQFPAQRREPGDPRVPAVRETRGGPGKDRQDFPRKAPPEPGARMSTTSLLSCASKRTNFFTAEGAEYAEIIHAQK